MSRPSVLTHNYHSYPQPGFDSIVHTGLSYRPLPIRAPELSAGYNQQHTGHHGRISTVRMSGPAYMASDEELANLQKLSSEYQPEVTGPLVGERQSSSAIATEYANADPIYRVKTAALPSNYAYFRTCRGDGHCGWRAIAFTYFEALLRVADVNKLEDEEARLQSMHNLLNAAGFPEHVYIDFVDEAFGLLQKLSASLRAMDGAGPETLLQTFNDPSTAMAIITYLKLLASAWMQSNPNDFAPFLEFNQDLKSYCSMNIEAAQCEIDHLGIAALAEAVIKPAGFALEVLYLDRSPGEEINTYRYEPTGHDGLPLKNPQTLRLLYRPGHYDILYKAEDVAQPLQQAQPVPTQAPLHVALAGYADEFVPMSSNIPDVMTMIPGMYPTGIGQRWPSVSYDYNPNPAPQPQIAPVPTYAPAQTPATPVASSHQEYVTPVHASHVNHHNPPSHHTIQLEPPLVLPIHPPPPPPVTIDRGPQMTIERGGPFRPSMYELEPGFHSGQPHALPFQTSIFRNSHYNTAHFLNPDFQPEEWSPDSEYATGNRGRHKSASQ
ncbi:cysteine proteinase [Lindgomyces ingoldianus]|uniref:Cysteine proteinase n=1 Tax=Lindgomyces ingoldianus TaxID=673940 RepID=A0ACB6QL03_9PLEO|nr:cysteine proteinase [Lindgomyces ingoldianus]KAF2467200.1 cysteine proteinase [Lindgomyces ingoldianus]